MKGKWCWSNFGNIWTKITLEEERRHEEEADSRRGARRGKNGDTYHDCSWQIGQFSSMPHRLSLHAFPTILRLRYIYNMLNTISVSGLPSFYSTFLVSWFLIVMLQIKRFDRIGLLLLLLHVLLLLHRWFPQAPLMRRGKMRLLLKPKGANPRKPKGKGWSITRWSCPEVIYTDLHQPMSWTSWRRLRACFTAACSKCRWDLWLS